MNLLTIDDTNYVKFDYIMSKDVNIYGEPIINGSAVGVVCKNDIITRYFISDKDSEVLPELVNESIGDLGTGRFGVSEDGRLEVIYDYYMDYETGITPQIEIYYDGNPITGRQMYSSS